MLDEYVRKYRNTGVLIDTNLLLFLVLAVYDINFAETHKLTRMYNRNDFLSLIGFLKGFNRVLTTPQVLGEVWSFIEKITGPRNRVIIQSAINYLLSDVVENYVEKDVILNETCLPYVGVTDVSVICSAKVTGALVLTDDLRAYNYYLNNQVEAININHFRVI